MDIPKFLVLAEIGHSWQTRPRRSPAIPGPGESPPVEPLSVRRRLTLEAPTSGEIPMNNNIQRLLIASFVVTGLVLAALTYVYVLV